MVAVVLTKIPSSKSKKNLYPTQLFRSHSAEINLYLEIDFITKIILNYKKNCAVSQTDVKNLIWEREDFYTLKNQKK